MEAEQIQDVVNLYLKNYSQISTLLNLDADPTTDELETTIMQMKIVFTNKPVKNIVAKLYRLLQEKGTQGIINMCSNIISPHIVSFIQQQTNPIPKHQLIRPLSRKPRFPYKPNTPSSYTYDNARVEQPSQPKIQKTSGIRSFTGDDRLLPLFKLDEKLNYEQKHYKSEAWNGAISTLSFNKDELHRYHQKQLAARALVYRGYGYPALKEQLIRSNSQIIIQSDRYKVVSCSMIVQIYRKIEEYINTNFTQKYIPLTSTQIKPLHAILFNAFKEFPKKYSDTLRKFIIITYNLTPNVLPLMSGVEAMELFRFIQITLHQKILWQQSKPVSLIPQSKYPGYQMRDQPISSQKKPYEFWTPQRQRLLIEGFHEFRSLCKVRQKFKICYPQLHTVSWFDYNFLKNRLDKMLRQVIRKMQVKINQNGIQLKRKFEINDARIKEIAKSPNSLDVRLLLTEIYRDDSYNQNNIKEAMRLIVEFFDKKNTFDFSRF